MRLVGFAFLLALVFGCTSPLTNGHTDGGQGGILPAAGGSGTSVLGNGGIGQGGSSALPGGSGGHTAVGTGGGAGGVTTLPRLGGSGGNPRVGTGGASGGVTTLPRLGGSGGNPRVGTGGASGGVTTVPGSGGDGGSAGGTSGSANLVVSTSVLNLGTIDLLTGGVGAVVVTNTGQAASGSIVVVASAGLSVTGCSGTLAPSASCSTTVVAKPTSLGTFTGTLTISANPGAYPTPITVAVVATVVGGAGVFTVQPTFIDLGPLPVGVAAPRQDITVTASVSITDLMFSSSGADVSIDVPATTCTSALAAGASCVVAVSFVATTAGPKKDSIVITAGGAGATTIAIPITAVAQTLPKLVISPPTAAFAAVTGEASSAVTFSVANIGDMPTDALSVAVTGPDAADFAITSNTCLVLASLGTCTLSVVFKPGPSDGGASRSATLTVTDAGAGGSSVTATLSGTQYAPAALVIYPSATDLGQAAVGAIGAATTFMLANTGDTPSGTITLTASSSELSITDDACSGVALAAKTGSCTFVVALKPTSVGAKAITLSATGSNGVSVERVFTGTGIIP